MKKSKQIATALIGMVACVGIICTLTANAEGFALKSKQTAVQTMTKEELRTEINRRFFDNGENLTQIADELGIKAYECLPLTSKETEMTEDERQKNAEMQIQFEKELTNEVRHRLFYKGDDLEQIADDLGIPIYENLPPIPIDLEAEESQEQGEEKIIIDSFPSKRADLPLITAFDDLPSGYASYTQNYFDPKSDTISVDYTFTGTSFETNERRVEVRLYRQRKSWAGSKEWEFVKKYSVTFFGSVSTTCIFNNLNNDDYVYCLGFNNVSTQYNTGSTQISGHAYISNSYD